MARACSGDWGAGDDRRMLRALLQVGAGAEWEVDWGTLVQVRGLSWPSNPEILKP